MKRLGRNTGLTATEGLLRAEQDSQPQRSLYSLEDGVISQGILRHLVTLKGISDTKSHTKWVTIWLWAEYQNPQRGDECRLRWRCDIVTCEERLASGTICLIYTGSVSLKQHKVVGTESRSGAKSALALKCSLERDFNTRHQLTLLEHSEGTLPRTQTGH